MVMTLFLNLSSDGESRYFMQPRGIDRSRRSQTPVSCLNNFAHQTPFAAHLPRLGYLFDILTQVSPIDISVFSEIPVL
jgi:hypothetical protein